MSTDERELSPELEPAIPSGLNLKLADQTLQITWADGHVSTFPLGLLRRQCPCAACKAERQKRDKPMGMSLPILSHKPVDDLRVVDANLCGNYAMKLIWSDGHDTGIYDFRYLRSLDSKLQ